MNETRKQIERISKYAWNNVSLDPRKRGETFIENMDKTINELKEKIGDLFNEDKIYNLYLDIVNAQSNTFSVMVTGAGNFNNSRHDKANRRLEKTWENLNEYIEKMEKLRKKIDKKASIKAQGGELAIAKKELEKLKEWQDIMKKANAILRSKPKYKMTDEKLEKLKELHNSFTIDFKGFEGFELTLNLGKIKRREQKIKDMERKQNTDDIIYTIDDDGIECEVAIKYSDNYINIKHKEKPSRDTINDIKKLGFRWNRYLKCWSRKITNNALYVLNNSKYRRIQNA